MAKTSMAGSGCEPFGKFWGAGVVEDGGVIGGMGESTFYRETGAGKSQVSKVIQLRITTATFPFGQHPI
jgi:hypothetical protein